MAEGSMSAALRCSRCSRLMVSPGRARSFLRRPVRVLNGRACCLARHWPLAHKMLMRNVRATAWLLEDRGDAGTGHEAQVVGAGGGVADVLLRQRLDLFVARHRAVHDGRRTALVD